MHIVLSVLAILFFGSGAFFRRWWGGWESPTHWVKIFVGIGLTLLVGVVFMSTTVAAVVFGFIMGVSFLNPLHSYGQRMGNGGPPFLTSLLVMAGSYSAFTTFASVVTFAIGASPKMLWFAPVGAIPALVYAASWMVFNKWFKNADGTFKKFWHTNDKIINGAVTQEWFIDGPTAVGECAIGAFLIGGLPILAALIR